jgi:hypothetical protein
MYKNIALPREVVKSLDKFAIEHSLDLGKLILNVHFDSVDDCFCFYFAKMYVRIEKDGYVLPYYIPRGD